MTRLGSRKPVERGREPKTLAELMASYERIILIKALQLNDFSRKKTAGSLGITPNHLWRRMKLLRINLTEIPKVIPGRPRKKTEP